MSNMGIGELIIIVLVVYILLCALMWWKLFVKAGQPGWASIVPIYNFWVLGEVSGRGGVMGLLMMLFPIGIIFQIIVFLGVAERFGKGVGFGIGLIFLGIIFFPVLGFGEAEYS